LSFTPACVVNDGLTLFTSVFARTTRTGGTVDAATAAGAGLTRALDEIVDAAAGARVTRVLCETVEAVDTDAAAEDETCEEARALGGSVEAADSDAAAAAEEETSGEACALGGPFTATDTDAAAVEEETCGEACALGNPVEVADTDAAEGEETCAFGKAAAADTSFGQTAAADTEDVARPLDDAVNAPETLRTLCEEDAPMLGLG
jgi:hypothetical protein